MGSTKDNSGSGLNLKIQLSGGAELLFGNQKNIAVSMPCSSACDPPTVKDLLVYLKLHHLKERPELFVQGDTVRPGILVLINGADWELEGELDYVLKNEDEVVFISTLHGG
ncbi:hypothetical protein SeMB42_g07264 [Synchytrium endobioticum]|uniref:Ubiquitin-related modifier 1 n=1 Tax=Synchytrium endobioticum TaxID=286115 RepID=A0A507BZT7_9FUNG|nr:hypothetical protein SeMB42_g07264 [Synchytrium endobioticum]TPX43335.1 hypothetical protein SeLEV6574_g05118 [Synchytrium endobioticum]